MASSPLGAVQRGDRVEVIGELVIESLSGPLEDDLSGARVWIKATSVALTDRKGAP